MSAHELSLADCATFEKVSVLRETDKAIHVLVDEGEFWIPKSQIHADSDVYKANTAGDLIVSNWIAREKGLL